MEIKHIYWFSYFNLSEPSVRYRAKYPLEQLQSQYGITSSVVLPERNLHGIWQFIKVFLSALLFRKKDSLIVFQKIYTNGLYAKTLQLLLLLSPCNTLYDIDDAEYTRRPAGTIHYFMKKCTACTVGSAALANYARQFNTEVALLTSPVIEHGVSRAPDNVFTVGWIGYYGAHRESLTRLLFPALQKTDFPVRLKLLGVAGSEEREEIRNYFSNKPNISLDMPADIDWQNEYAVYRHVASFDVGVSPLTDTEFNRAKSAFKLKQCLSCGIPVLGSSVGENLRFLKDGVNGYLCDSPDDYYENICRLQQLPAAAYSLLSENAKQSITQFSIAHYCAALLSFYSSKAVPAPTGTTASL